MNGNNKLIWSALEYEEKERSKDWFWALGIIVVTSSIASIIFENYFFAALLLLAGFLLGFFAIKKPDTITYELNEKGLKVRDRLYPYENIKSFWIQINSSSETNSKEGEENIKPMLFIHSERMFMPVFSMPIDEDLAEDIHSIMLSQNVAEVEMKEHPSEKIMEMIGF
jgi:hypothetical protein